MPDRRATALQGFADWADTHVKGDEKGEAQIFLDRLFQAFGHKGVKEAGANCEVRVRNDGGGVSFADLVWKPTVLIEMKRRGTDLAKHFRQAFDYWVHLVPGRPRYVVLCNFDEFWVYDFEAVIDQPVDVVALRDLSRKYGPLNFLYPEKPAPIFGGHQEEVTRSAADKLASCFNSLLQRGIDRPLAQRFTLQMLMALFAEDIGLLERYFVRQLLDDCSSPQASFDLIGGLFNAMNTPGGMPGGRFKGVAYFNGGLFAQPAQLELPSDEITVLREASNFDWSKVRPEIFGTLFERSLGAKDRHAYGAHFTSPADIMKIVGPTIVEPWREQIEAAGTLGRLRELLARLERFRVLDPACGSGNFLFIAYREIKRLEAQIYERMAQDYASVDPLQRPFGFVTTGNFFGIDINPFAIDIAKVTMMLAHKLSIDELHISERALPLDNLDSNFRASDALVNADGSRADWFPADAIIGNPPFLGAKLIRREHGAEYADRLRRAYPEVPGMADLCVYWIRRAHDLLAPTTADDPVVGRAGLVGTQNIRNNQSRVGGLDHVVADGTIVEAVDNQPWSGQAAVHVSIFNWAKTQDARLLPKRKRLWFVDAATKSLDFRATRYISSALSDQVDVSGAVVLESNRQGIVVCQGVTPGHAGFVLEQAERDKMVAIDPRNADVLFEYLTGDDMLSGRGLPARWLIDFGQRDIVTAQSYKSPFERLRRFVLPAIQATAAAGRSERADSLNNWWQLWRRRADLIAALAGVRRYIACSRVTQRPIFSFVRASIRPGDSLQAFVIDDDYSFGILQGLPHLLWFAAKSSKLEARLRYTPESVFSTMPWPQSPTTKQVQNVAEAARAVRDIRLKAINGGTNGLRALYSTLGLPGANPLRDAHNWLDTAVGEAYGFSNRKDLLTQLLDLNMAVASEAKKGKSTLGPGLPATMKENDRAGFVSADCLGGPS